jgi:phospho-N-acetylmuramoyl-pentapeptide-transferase
MQLTDFFNSLPLRGVLAFFAALFLSLACGEKLIGFLHRHQAKGQPIREDGPQSHLLTKKGTPTMGGLLILGSAIVSMLLFADLHNSFVWISILVLLVYGLTGFADDYVKVTKQTANAMTAKMKLFLQFTTALAAVWVITQSAPETGRFELSFPWFRSLALNLGWFYVPFAMIVIAGASNAVNLSDGLDGLASGLLIVSFLVFAVIAYVCGTEMSAAVGLTPVAHSAEIVVVCAAVVGGCVGFLWFNAPPARVFMGDTGSLALGALLGTVSVMTRHEILLAVVGGVFIVEALSVMIQVAYFRKTGRRFFKMAPVHHHFEQLGWKETTVVVRFWIAAFILGVLGLTSLIVL